MSWETAIALAGIIIGSLTVVIGGAIAWLRADIHAIAEDVQAAGTLAKRLEWEMDGNGTPLKSLVRQNVQGIRTIELNLAAHMENRHIHGWDQSRSTDEQLGGAV